jgi:hypothetical protein
MRFSRTTLIRVGKLPLNPHRTTIKDGVTGFNRRGNWLKRMSLLLLISLLR